MGKDKRVFQADEAGVSDWFDIFCVGTHNGQEYAMEALQQMLRNFRPGDMDTGLAGDPDVPAFIGHNDFWSESEKPALAWVKELRIEGDYLQARFHRIQPELAEANDSGRFCKRSVELWHNFRGRGMTLTGVAFLGSNTPACVLRDNTFRKGRDDNSFAVAINDNGDRRGFSTMFKTQSQGGEDMDEAKLKSMLDEAAEKAVKSFKESDEFKSLAEKAERLEAENKQFAEEATEAQRKAKRASAESFADKLLEDKKITPAIRSGGLVEFLESLDGDKPMKFGAKECSQAEMFRELFAAKLDAAKLFDSADEDGPRADENVPADDVNKPIEFSLGG